MGLDVGTKTIGVAVSDELGWTAQGVEVVQRQDEQSDLSRMESLIQAHNIKEIVVGLPKNMNGTIGVRGETCLAFGKRLKDAFGLPVHFWDERLTTVSAERMLIAADVSRKKRKKVIDKMAAVLILQGYLDAHSRRGIDG
jgi:putative Holliday junction resolvase